MMAMRLGYTFNMVTVLIQKMADSIVCLIKNKKKSLNIHSDQQMARSEVTFSLIFLHVWMNKEH